jgi:hypothetical protein
MTKSRTLRLTEDGTGLVITQQEGSGRVQRDAYFLSVEPGKVVMSKHDGEKHTVTEQACTCKGHQFYGHRTTCKHRAAVARLIALGKIKLVEVK